MLFILGINTKSLIIFWLTANCDKRRNLCQTPRFPTFVQQLQGFLKGIGNKKALVQGLLCYFKIIAGKCVNHFTVTHTRVNR